jgi:hypothetical protein
MRSNSLSSFHRRPWLHLAISSDWPYSAPEENFHAFNARKNCLAQSGLSWFSIRRLLPRRLPCNNGANSVSAVLLPRAPPRRPMRSHPNRGDIWRVPLMAPWPQGFRNRKRAWRGIRIDLTFSLLYTDPPQSLLFSELDFANSLTDD